jgi:hypothetical protein
VDCEYKSIWNSNSKQKINAEESIFENIKKGKKAAHAKKSSPYSQMV